LELNGTHDFLLYADVNLLGENVNELPWKAKSITRQ
jgi:hypothetical protein